MLALFAPGPRPLVLGGTTWQARPLRVGDLFQLGLYAAGMAPDPLADLDPDNPDALRAAFDAAEAWPPDWPEGYRSTAGHLYALASVLRDHALSGDDAATLFESITAPEWAALERVAFGGDPAVVVQGMIDRHLGIVEPDRPGVPWPEAVAETCSHYHLSPPQVLELTLPELRMLRSGGKRSIVDPNSAPEAQMTRWAFFYPDQADAMPAVSGERPNLPTDDLGPVPFTRPDAGGSEGSSPSDPSEPHPSP